jgi:O-antigen/teichoic acid export membrane protein
MMINLTVSVALNLLLIPIFGLFGAAVTTAITFVCSAISVNLAAHKWLGYRRGVLLY